MKKFYQFVGMVILRLVVLSIIIISSATITLIYYETEKEEIFGEMYGYFTMYMESSEETMMENYGLIEDVIEPEPITNI